MRSAILAVAGVLVATRPGVQGVDPALAAVYFREAAALCERDGGRLWGVSICGPMVLADPLTKTVATNQPEPPAARPALLGMANAAVTWGGERWTTISWPLVPADPHLRARLFAHELFHRIQPDLGLMTADGRNDHLDSIDGRYWIQLEWRALERALGSDEADVRRAASLDALAFRAARHALVAGAAEQERLELVREGLAQYTGTVLAASDAGAARADAIRQLQAAPAGSGFVRTFAYPSGAAYGLLLDAARPDWRLGITAASDVPALLLSALGESTPPDADADRELRYGGAALLEVERARAAAREARLADLRRRFVEGPVLTLPNAPGAFSTDGVTPIPGVGTVYPQVRVTTPWGALEADLALRSDDRQRLVLPAPAGSRGPVLTGDGWVLRLAPGWVVEPGGRRGDLVVKQP